MSVDLYRLDSIEDYEEAIVALEDYVADLVEEFIQAPEGEAYLKTHPEVQNRVGNWINHLIHVGYAYEEPVALPHMTPKHVEDIVTRWFPRKESLENPDAADTAIPELIAFWSFLKRVYPLPCAGQILTFLKQIQPQFKAIMTDPEHFGAAKSFFISSHPEGDMITEEELEAFQAQSNQRRQSSTANPPSAADNVRSLKDMIPLAGDISSGRPDSAKFQNFVSSLLGDLSLGALQIGDTSSGDFEEQLAKLSQSGFRESAALSETEIATLKQQVITEGGPGSILKDFQILLDFVGDTGIVVSGKHCLIPLKHLSELNQSLTAPIQLDLKRPKQKSFPPINGLYLILRASGLGQIVNQGKKEDSGPSP